MWKSGYIEFKAAAKAENMRWRKRAHAMLKMRNALSFSHSPHGRIVMGARAGLSRLGMFGAALWAMYPVIIVLVMARILFSAAAPI